MAKSIKLVTNFETGAVKEYFQPSHIKGSVALEGLTIGKSIDKKGAEIGEEDIKKIAAFVANKVYGGEFSAGDLIDGIHAPLLFETVMGQLSTVLGDDSGNGTKAKKN